MPRTLYKHERKAWSVYVNHVGPAHARVSEFRDRYQGTYKHRSDFARQLLVDTEKLPEKFFQWIDVDAYLEALRNDDFVFIDDGNDVHVFLMR